MNKLLSAIVLSACTCFSCFSTKTVNTDVFIYGSTSAGVIAAYSIEKQGKSAIVADPDFHIGGMTSGGLGLTDIGNKYVVTGLSRDFYRRVGQHYGKFEQWIFEPHVASGIFKEYINEAGIELMQGFRLEKVNVADKKVVSVSGTLDGKPVTVSAKMFVDCSYEGDLMAKAGVSYTTGREDNSVYGETYNGVQVLDGHQFPDGIDPYVEKGNPASGLLWGISENPVMSNGHGDRKIQAYNYRIALTDNPDNMIPITRPDGYDPDKYELLIRLKEKQPWKSLNDIFIWSKMPGNKTDINNRGGFSTDMIGMNWDYPEAGYDKRKEIAKTHEVYTKGLLYFLGNDSRIPEFIRREMLRWGYPKDEYADNGNWSPQLYVREARRMVSDLVMTQLHCVGRETVSDPIAMAAYTMDSHNCDRHVVNGMVKNEGNVEVGGFPPYPISYRSICPKRNEIQNMLVPVCLSASHIAYGSIRMEPVFMVLAQVSATAACLAIDKNAPIQDVDYRVINASIKNNPLSDGSKPETLVDNADSSLIETTGEWEPYFDSYRAYGPDFKVCDPRKKPHFSMKFKPAVDDGKEYEIYMYVPMIEDITPEMTVTIFDGKKTEYRKADIAGISVEGQTAGEWLPLGKAVLHKGCYVEISERGASGIVPSDAILFVPHNK